MHCCKKRIVVFPSCSGIKSNLICTFVTYEHSSVVKNWNMVATTSSMDSYLNVGTSVQHIPAYSNFEFSIKK